MSKRTPSKMSSFFNSTTYEEDLSKVDDILNTPVEIKGVQWRKGQSGEYAIMTLDLLETGVELKVSCGGMAVCDMLHAAEQGRAFPFQVMFTKKGRLILPVDPE